MSALTPIQPITMGVADRPFISSGMLMSSSWEQGVNDSIMGAGSRLLKNFEARYNGPLLSPQEAQDRFGMEGLAFTEPITEAEAQMKRDRKQWERRRQFIMDTGSTGLARWAGSMAVGMVASISNPLDLAASAIPFVGSSAKVGMVARAGGGRLAQLAARGIVTEEALAGFTRFPRFSAAVIEGVAGQALVEPITAWANIQDQADYGLDNAVINIAMAGALAGGLRAGFTALLGSSRFALNKAIEVADNQLREGRPVHVNDVLEADAIKNDPGRASESVAILERLGEKMDPAERRALIDELKRNYSAKEPGQGRQPATWLDLLYEARTEEAKGTNAGIKAGEILDRYYAGDHSPELFHKLSILVGKEYSLEKATLDAQAKLAEVSKSRPQRQGVAATSKEFDNLVIEHGPELGWIKGDEMYFLDANADKSGSTAGIHAKVKQSRQMALARQRALADIGQPISNFNSLEGRAASLDALKTWLREKNLADKGLDAVGETVVEPDPVVAQSYYESGGLVYPIPRNVEEEFAAKIAEIKARKEPTAPIPDEHVAIPGKVPKLGEEAKGPPPIPKSESSTGEATTVSNPAIKAIRDDIASMENELGTLSPEEKAKHLSNLPDPELEVETKRAAIECIINNG